MSMRTDALVSSIVCGILSIASVAMMGYYIYHGQTIGLVLIPHTFGLFVLCIMSTDIYFYRGKYDKSNDSK